MSNTYLENKGFSPEEIDAAQAEYANWLDELEVEANFELAMLAEQN